MKAAIHPDYHEVTVHCNCGYEVVIRSTYKKSRQMKLEVCGQCHSYYTGKQKPVDTKGRVEQFYTRYAKKPPESPKV